ncbi:MAG: acetate/propionate family kinase [Pirellulales bacterium]
MKILVANLGSTSFKYRLFDLPERAGEAGAERELARGGVERIGAAESRVHATVGGRVIETVMTVPDHAVALQAALAQLTADGGPLTSVDEVAAVGFKAVHGGRVSGVVKVGPDVLAAMEEMAAVAPAHNPPYVRAMRLLGERMPGVPLVAAFETGFHATIPDRNAFYAVPTEWVEKHLVRRWGFHGASHRFVAGRLGELVSAGAKGLRAVSCHLGGSSSVCWIREGRSVGTSMGMSPQSGLPQNNRAGDFDPFALLHVAKQTGRSFEDLLVELSGKAGLAGMSGTSGDMRDLEEAAAAGSRRAQTAIDVYVASVRHWLGAGIVELGGLDAIGFAGGIGENSPLTRAAVAAGLEDLGVAIDPAKNAAQAAGERSIHAASSRVAIWVIPTNEELIVARQARDLLAADRGTANGKGA